MKINISGHHVDLTDGIRAHVHDKMERIKRHFDKPVEVDVTVSVEKQEQKVDLHMHAINHDFHVSKANAQLYTAIDEAVDVMDKQIRRFKEKIQDSRKHDKTALAQDA